MYCIKCGNKISDDALFCAKCGTRVARGNSARDQMTSSTGGDAGKPVQRKRKRWPIVTLFSILIIVILAVLIGLYVRSNSPQRRLQEQLDLGYRYLTELNYEKAVAAFEAAIEIDPQNVEAYLGLIDAYKGSGDADGIINAYRQAFDNLEKSALKDISEAASDSIAEIIDDLVSDGDYDSAKKLVYDLSEIDPKRSEHILFYVIDHQNIDASDHDPDNDPDDDDEEISDEGIELINSGNYDEAISYYNELIADNPNDPDPYIALATILLAADDPVSALQLLENGIAAGADSGMLLLAEEYIRDNTIPVSSIGTIFEFDSDMTGTYYFDGWIEIAFDEHGNKISYEKQVEDIEHHYIEYDQNGNAVYEDIQDYGRQTYWRTFNDAGEMIYSKLEFDNTIFDRIETTETYYSYKYDSLGRVTERYEDADNDYYGDYYKGTTYYEYDSAGNLISEKAISVSGDTMSFANYVYDSRGNVIEDSNAAGGSSYTYDLMDMVIHEDWVSGVGGRHATTDYVNTYHFTGNIENLLNEYYHG